MFPVAHGRALADAISGAQLVELEDVGHHCRHPNTWGGFVDTLIDHTATA